MTAPALGLTLRPPRTPPPRTPEWGAWLTATAVTLLLGMFMASGLVVRSGWIVPRTDREAAPAERITFVDVPPAALTLPPEPTAAGDPTAPAVPTPRPAAPLPFPTAPGAARGAAPTRPAVPAVPVPPAAPTVSRDTASAAPVPDGRRPSALAPRVLIPSAPLRAPLPPPPSAGDRVAPRVDCAAPCLGGTTVGAGVGRRPLTREEEAERLRAIGRSVPGMAAKMGRPSVAPAEGPRDPGAPKELQGVSVPVGLPWGGPTKAERERDARLRTEYAATLARLRTRAESLAVLDSLERLRRAPRSAPPR